MSGGSKKIIAVIIFAIILVVTSAIIFLSGEKIAPNVSIDGLDVGTMSLEEAKYQLQNFFGNNLKENYMNLEHEGKMWQLNYSEINYNYDYDKALAEAYDITRRGSLFKRYFDSIKVRMNKTDIPLGFSYDKEEIKKFISNIAKEINSEPIDATIRLVSGKFQITDEKLGSKLNEKKAFEMIDSAIENKSITTIKLPLDKVEAEITRADLSNITDKLGEFATSFNASNESRSYNIKLATKSVTDVLVRPGETFSLNKTIGPRLAKYGYRSAKVLINNEYVDGIGGGVCQVSSTLYNAALLANLKIVERKNHSLPSSYIGLGRDATISGDYIDLKFMNNTPYPLYIYGEVKGNQVKFSIYGKNENRGREIKIKTEVLKKIEPKIKIIEDRNLPIGTKIVEKKPIPGYVVRSYRVIVENGKEVLVEPLFTDTYRASDGVTRVGTKPIAKEENTDSGERETMEN